MKRVVITIISMVGFSALAFGCGGGQSTAPATSPTTTAAEPVKKPAEPTPPVDPTPAASSTPTPTSSTPPAEATPEKCDQEWTCVKVSFDKKKVEKRETKLIGDPKIDTTWSKNSDGRAVSFDNFSKGAVELTLKRKPGNKNEVVVKLGPKGQEIVVDKKDGTIDDFTHVGAIAAEQDGWLLIDLRYMK
jgi:hypothetical protein